MNTHAHTHRTRNQTFEEQTINSQKTLWLYQVKQNSFVLETGSYERSMCNVSQKTTSLHDFCWQNLQILNLYLRDDVKRRPLIFFIDSNASTNHLNEDKTMALVLRLRQRSYDKLPWKIHRGLQMDIISCMDELGADTDAPQDTVKFKSSISERKWLTTWLISSVSIWITWWPHKASHSSSCHSSLSAWRKYTHHRRERIRCQLYGFSCVLALICHKNVICSFS